MNRCQPSHDARSPSSSLRALLTGATVLLAALAASAQDVSQQVQTQNEAALGGRTFPVGTLRGKMVITGFPEMQLDGIAERLAPGARIRSTQNMIVQPQTITGQYLAVNYRRDAAGLVSEVWILTPTEASAERAQLNKPFLNFWPFVSSAENEAN